MRAPWRLLLAVVFVAIIVVSSCSGEPPPMPSLSVTSKPARIDDMGETSTITVTATQADGTPGSGSVKVTSAAGSLKAGTSVTLGSNGKGETPFTCAVSGDSACMGRVAITAEWNSITATTRIQVGDAGIISGTGGGAGGGSGGGTGGGGGGSSDAGPSDGGTTDGGSTDGGSSDGGRRDAGALPPTDGGPIENVRLLGKLDMNATWAYADLGNPTSPRIGFPPGVVPGTAVVRPFTGGLLYLDELNDLLLELVDDDYGSGSTAVYPMMAAMNDVLQATPMCTTNPVTDFWVWPDTGNIVYRCNTETKYWEGTNEVTALNGYDVFALGYGGFALARSSVSFTPVVVDTLGGTMARSVVGLQSFVQLNVLTRDRQRSVRAAPDGFFVTLGQPPNDTQPCQLYKIANDGTAAIVDNFTGPPPSVMVPSTGSCAGRLDATLNLYGFGTSSGDDVVVKYPRMLGQSTSVYTEAGAQPSNFGQMPPMVFTFVEPGASLVTSP